MQPVIAAMALCCASGVASAQSLPDEQLGTSKAKQSAGFFVEMCVSPLRNYDKTDVDDLVHFSKLEVRELEIALGMSFEGWNIQRAELGGMVLILRNASNPNPCTVTIFNLSYEGARQVWDQIVELDSIRVDTTFELAKENEVIGKSFRDWGLGAIHLNGLDFVQVSEVFRGTVEAGQVILTATRVPASFYACRLYPEVC